MRQFYLYLLLAIIFLQINCYTTFRHPIIETNTSSYYEVRINDDCMECHQTYPGTLAILPNAAIQDYNWQFYSHGAWWEDVVSYTSGGYENYLPPTGSRLPNPPHGPEGSINVPGPGPKVSKPVAGDGEKADSEKDDGRREFDRRKEATEEPSQRDTKRRAPQKK